MNQQATRRQFTAALDALVAQIKEDRSVLATILCGSLSHDTVWAKSDIDLVLVTIDDRKLDEADLALYADGLNVHAVLLPRTEFRKTVEGSVHNSFIHSFLAKGKLLYTHDPTVADLCARLQARGGRDQAIALLHAATGALPSLYKAHKWFITRGDLEYTALWILATVSSLARVEVIEAGLLADREVIPQALTLNPAFFTIVYTDLLNAPKSRAGVQAALAAIDAYLASRAPSLFAPVIEHLRDVAEPRGCRDLEHHFKKTYGIEGVVTACEYLADQGLIGKASVPVRLTKRSHVEVQELAFVFLSEPPDEF
jgi:predicted nucleotidyltransferase